MEKILVIVFESEDAARKGVRALYKLQDEARIELYELAAIRKNEDGTTTRLREDNDFPAPSGTLAGAAIGSLMGLLGGGMLDRTFPRFADDLAWWTAAAWINPQAARRSGVWSLAPHRPETAVPPPPGAGRRGSRVHVDADAPATNQ